MTAQSPRQSLRVQWEQEGQLPSGHGGLLHNRSGGDQALGIAATGGEPTSLVENQAGELWKV